MPASTKRHPDFYFDEPETVTFEVHSTHSLYYHVFNPNFTKIEGVQFRPHLFILQRYCGLFRDMPAIAKKQSDLTSSESRIKLRDILPSDRNNKGMSAEAFELGLRVLYPECERITLDWPPLTSVVFRVLLVKPIKIMMEWIQVLEISHWWQSDYMRRVALAHLEGHKQYMSLSERCTLGNTYSIVSWVLEIYRELAMRSGSMSLEELDLIPLTHRTGVFLARERFREVFLYTFLSDRCLASSSTFSKLFNYAPPMNLIDALGHIGSGYICPHCESMHDPNRYDGQFEAAKASVDDLLRTHC